MTEVAKRGEPDAAVADDLSNSPWIEWRGRADIGPIAHAQRDDSPSRDRQGGRDPQHAPPWQVRSRPRHEVRECRTERQRADHDPSAVLRRLRNHPAAILRPGG